jgi:hypothetical protein
MIASLLSIAAAVAAASPARVIGVSGAWAAIDRQSSCEAVTRSPFRPAGSGAQAVAGFRFTPDRRQWGQFHASLSREPRPGATVMLEVGGQSFLLVARGRDAWSRGTAQDQAIIAASRSAGAFRVSARSASGRRFSDRFEPRGAATAIDQAAARCALRGAGKIR